MSTICYYNGVRLWKNAQTLRANPKTSGASSKAGLSKKRARLYPRSPNALYDISVMTSVPPVDEISVAVGRQATHHLYMLQTEKRLVAQGGQYGFLSWVVDEDTKNDVSSVSGSGAASTVTLSSFAGFTPVTGDYVLFRNPTTGDGFVTQVDGVGTLTILVDLQRPDLDRTMEDVAVTSAWDVILLAYHFPYAHYQQVGWTDTPSQGEDKHGTAMWAFTSESDVVNSSALDLDLT